MRRTIVSPSPARRVPCLAGLLALALLPACATGGGAPPPTSGPVRFGFDGDAAGRVPAGWRVEATRSGVGGPGAALANWAVAADATAPSPGQVLALTAAAHGQQDTFNLCWTDGVAFRDGLLRVAVKAVAGDVDLGGGPMWRVQDRDNYYVCRFNPLEANFRVYRVQDGMRQQLGTVITDVAAGTWHVIEVRVDGPRMTCSLDGRVTLSAEDSALPETGGVGVWTKADAVTSFDDLLLEPSGL